MFFARHVDYTSFTFVFTWVITHGYPLMFLAMCIEGPVVTLASAFAAAMGYFNIWAVFILAILGDMIPDIVYYSLGYTGRLATSKWWKNYLATPKPRLEKLARLLKHHEIKTIIALKLMPFLSVPGFMMVGASHLSFRRFTAVCLAVTLPKAVLFSLLGFFVGAFFKTHPAYLQHTELFLTLLGTATISILILANRISARIAQKLEEAP